MSLKFILTLVIFLPLFVSCKYFENEICNHAPLLWNMNRLDSIKKNQYEIAETRALLYEADNLMLEKDIAVTQKSNSINHDKHNYESLSSYFWPNTTDSIAPYIERDGILNPETKTDDRHRLDKATKRITKFALAYYLFENDKYADACIRQIKVWFLNKDTYMYPHFKYAQVIKNVNGNKGQPHGIIDAYVMNNILESIRLLDINKKLKKKDKRQLKKWFEDFAIWLTTADLGIRESKQKNNHSIAYDVLLLDISLFTDNQQRADSIVSKFKDKRLSTLIMEDGSQPGEQRRTRSYYYSYYNLIHVVDFCKMLQSLNVNYYAENKTNIDQAFKYLLSFSENREQYPYKEIGNWENIVTGLKVECGRLNQLAEKTASAKSYPNYEVDIYNNINLWIK